MSVANPCGTQSDRFDRTRRVACVDYVADSVLVFYEHENPAQQISNEGLSSEANCYAQDSGAGN